MTTFHFQTHISADGTLSPIPDWPGGEADAIIVVRQPEKTRENEPIDDGWRPDPSAVREFLEWRKPLAENITDEEIEQLKHERRMRKMQ